MKKLSTLKTRTLTGIVGLSFLFFVLPYKSLTRFLILFIFSYITFIEWPKIVKHLNIFQKYFWTFVFLILPAASLIALNEQPNRLWGLILMAIVFLHDSAAYIVGSLIGKHKIAPAISPNKSWEGLAAGFFLTLMILISTNCYNLIHATFFALFISIMATTGDFCESYLKRKADIKDTGNLLPGHGGLLDRFDAIFFLAPWWYLIQPNVCNFF